jgi:uncharacterized membrane protein YvbJ
MRTLLCVECGREADDDAAGTINCGDPILARRAVGSRALGRLPETRLKKGSRPGVALVAGP